MTGILRGNAFPLLALVAAAMVGVLVATSLWLVPLLAAGALLLVTFPRVAIACTAVTLPFAPILIVPIGGLVVGVAQLLAAVAILGLLVHNETRHLNRQAATALLLVAPYALVGLWVTAGANATVDQYATLVQRVGIVVSWPLLGMLVQRAGQTEWFLRWFVGSSVAVAALWIGSIGDAYALGMQKNASSIYLGAAILAVLLMPLHRRTQLIAGAVLGAGLLATGSRGELLGVAVACVLLLLAVSQWKRLVVPALVFATVVILTLALMPAELTNRLLGRTGLNTIDLRETFVRDALWQWRAAPDGQGVGGYEQLLRPLQAIATHDPHNVWILALVEGGWPLLLAFVALIAGGLWQAWQVHKHWVGLLALLVQVATLVHVTFGVYWARGTPAVGWLLVGCSIAAVPMLRASAPPDAILREASTGQLWRSVTSQRM